MADLHRAESDTALAKLRVLDLFAGPPPHGWSAAFRDRGHNVTTLDWESRFGADIQLDIRQLRGLGKFDVILASPPCETFSVASIGHHWTGGRGAYVPKTPRTCDGLAIMRKTFALIEEAGPAYYVIENPIGVMRQVAPRRPTAQTWFCQWGDARAKPTDLWTNVPILFPTCRNGAADHERAPRGAKTGTQGLRDAAERGRIPYALSLAVCLAVE